jgi:iron only hydrogenase large subunit-like protein
MKKRLVNVALMIVGCNILMLLLLPGVDSFSVQLPSTRKLIKELRPRHQEETRLLASVAAATNEEKFTKEANELLQVLDAKERGDQDRYGLIVAQIAPSVRVAIPEAFGLEPGSISTGKLVASLKQLGFDLVLDTNTAADLTVCEEGTELLHRLKARAEHMEGDAREYECAIAIWSK